MEFHSGNSSRNDNIFNIGSRDSGNNSITFKETFRSPNIFKENMSHLLEYVFYTYSLSMIDLTGKESIPAKDTYADPLVVEHCFDITEIMANGHYNGDLYHVNIFLVCVKA